MTPSEITETSGDFKTKLKRSLYSLAEQTLLKTSTVSLRCLLLSFIASTIIYTNTNQKRSNCLCFLHVYLLPPCLLYEKFQLQVLIAPTETCDITEGSYPAVDTWPWRQPSDMSTSCNVPLTILSVVFTRNSHSANTV